MSRKQRHGTKKTSSTQTEEVDAMLEIARLQEQVKLLTIENTVLRNHTAISPQQTGLRGQRMMSVQGSARSAKGIKGCSCKGNCSSKICGCMKKNQICGEACKCNSAVCQNQSPIENEGTTESRRDVDTKDSPEAEQMQNVRQNHGLFSPLSDEAEFARDELVRPGEKLNSAKVLIFSPSDDDDTGPKRKNRRKLKNGKQIKSSKSNGNKENLKPVSKDGRRTRSASNDKKNKTDDNMKLYEIRKCVSNEIDMLNDESSDMVFNPPNDPNPVEDAPMKMQGVVEHVTSRKANRTVGKVEKAVKENEIVNEDRNQPEIIKKGKMQTPKEYEYEIDISSSLSNKTSSTINDTGIDSYENDPTFDPTKPKHQLARTPPNSSNTAKRSPRLRPSEVYLPVPVNESVEEEYNIQKDTSELMRPNVDWNEHQAQLVMCKRCKRKFLPARIKKHEACCKGL